MLLCRCENCGGEVEEVEILENWALALIQYASDRYVMQTDWADGRSRVRQLINPRSISHQQPISMIYASTSALERLAETHRHAAHQADKQNPRKH